MAVSTDVIVVGGGVIGTAIAWRAAAAGLDVTLLDPRRDDGASLVAAGMLAPVSESIFGEEALLRLNLLAVRRFPAFAAELEERTGQHVGLRQEGTLAVAYDPGDHAALLRLTEFRRSVGLGAAELDSRAVRKLEPFLTPEVRGGALFAGDWSVDNRRYLAALRQAAQDAGVRTVPGQVSRITGAGAELADGTAISGATVVVAAGWGSAGIAWPRWSARSRASCCGCGCPRPCRRCSATRCGPRSAAPTSTWCREPTANWSSGPPRRNAARIRR